MWEKLKNFQKPVFIGLALIIILLVLAGIYRFTVGSIYHSTVIGEYSQSPGDLGMAYGENIGLSSKSLDLGIFSRDNDTSANAPMASEDYYETQEGNLTLKKIIKNASLTMYVKNAEQIAGQVQQLALQLEGFVAESNIYKSSDGLKRGNLTIRIPVNNFEQALHNVKSLAEEVENETVKSEDVTEKYVDLEAQLRNLRAEEAQYLSIMQKSYTINDTLSVANRLSTVRGQIERIQGQLNYLSRQVDMSTIRITLSADADIEVFGIRWRPLIVVKRSFKNMLEDLSGFADGLIAFLFKLPVIILTLAVIVFFAVIALKLIAWLYRKFFKKHIKPGVKNEQN